MDFLDPKLWSFELNSVSKMAEINQVVFLVNSLFMGSILVMNFALWSKKTVNTYFTLLCDCHEFFGCGDWYFLLIWLCLCSRVITVDSCSVFSYDGFHEFRVTVTFQHVICDQQMVFFWLWVIILRMNFADTCCTPRSSFS